jgi:predicted HicB family RNase H-like nuclease
MMEYNGYVGEITAVDEKQGLIHGRVAGLIDVITFEGSTSEELVQAFHDSVDDSLDFCEQRKESPERPSWGKFLVWIAPDLHRKAELAARKSGQSLIAWVASAIEAELQKQTAARKRRASAGVGKVG